MLLVEALLILKLPVSDPFDENGFLKKSLSYGVLQ